MKAKPILLFVAVIYAATAYAQNPYQQIGKDAKVLTLTDGKFNEFHPNDSLRRVSSVVVNMRTKKVYQFIIQDTLYSEATLDPTVLSRWLSLDPLMAKYPSISPYAFGGNSPILIKDSDGRDIIVTGKEAELFMSTLGKLTGLTFKLDANNNLVYEENGETTGDPVLKKLVMETINNKDVAVQIHAIPQSKEVFFDQDKREGGTQPNAVDMGDMALLDEKPEFQGALLGHVIQERSNKSKRFTPAHAEGINKETEILEQNYPNISGRSAQLDRSLVKGMKLTIDGVQSDFYMLLDYGSKDGAKDNGLWLRYDYKNGQTPNINTPDGVYTTNQVYDILYKGSKSVESDIDK